MKSKKKRIEYQIKVDWLGVDVVITKKEAMWLIKYHGHAIELDNDDGLCTADGEPLHVITLRKKGFGDEE